MMDKEIYLKRLAEDCAYTFKGLYKTADWLKLEYKLYLAVPIIFSIVSFGFEEIMSPLALKLLAVLSMIFTSLALINQEEYNKIEKYTKLANKYKTLYDEIEADYHKRNFDNIDIYKQKIQKLREKTSKYPINLIGRWWSKKRIEDEMDLAWLKTNGVWKK